MIPDHLIDQATAAIYASSAFGDRFALDAWRDMADDNPIKTTTRMYARAALEAVAADIWEEGAESGWQATGEGWNGEYANGTTHDGAQSFRDAGNDTPNPYRASETA